MQALPRNRVLGQRLQDPYTCEEVELRTTATTDLAFSPHYLDGMRPEQTIRPEGQECDRETVSQVFELPT